MAQVLKGSHRQTPDREEIVAGVSTVLTELGLLAHDHVLSACDMAAELEVDSLEATSIALALEERFGVIVPDTMMNSIRTPAQIVDAIITLTQASNGSAAVTTLGAPSGDAAHCG